MDNYLGKILVCGYSTLYKPHFLELGKKKLKKFSNADLPGLKLGKFFGLLQKCLRLFDI